MHNNNYSYWNEQSVLQQAFLAIRYVILFSICVLAGCTKQVYESASLDLVEIQQQQSGLSPDSIEFRQFLKLHLPDSEFPIKNWQLPSLTLAALYFNPSIELAQSELAIIDAELVIAGQKPNPTINLPLEYRTEPGGSPWLFGLVGDFIFERSSKRQAKIDIVYAQRLAKEIALLQLGWSIYHAIHQNLIDYYTQIEIAKNLERQKILLTEILGLLEQRLEYGQASEFELSRIRLELQRIELALSNQQFKTNDSLHSLFSHTGLLIKNIKSSEFEFKQLESHLVSYNDRLDSLNQKMLSNRFDFRTKLTEYQVFENELKLEIEKQYPDINLSPGFIYEQGDSIWQLGAAWVLPMFHNNDGQIERALAKREKKQLEILQLQNELLQQLERRKQNYKDKLTAYEKSSVILETQKQRSIEIEKQYELGYQDRLSLIRARLETEKTKEAVFEISVAVMQSAAALEDVLQRPLDSDINLEQWIKSLKKNKQ